MVWLLCSWRGDNGAQSNSGASLWLFSDDLVWAGQSAWPCATLIKWTNFRTCQSQDYYHYQMMSVSCWHTRADICISVVTTLIACTSSISFSSWQRFLEDDHSQTSITHSEHDKLQLTHKSSSSSSLSQSIAQVSAVTDEPARHDASRQTCCKQR